MKIAILGATSQIAQDLILSFSKNKDYECLLFSRNIVLLKKWIKSANLKNSYKAKEYADFDCNESHDIIINFVGVGDPLKSKKVGNGIFKITEQYDDMALNYIDSNKKTKYIFISSGAVYGGNYQNPVNESTAATVNINNLDGTDWYRISKLYAESKHRSLAGLSIIDVRVFNYFSHSQDMRARFLITDMVRSIKNKEIFKTSEDNIVRDFMTPPDFYNLIQAVIESKPMNMALDCYTKSPISKFELLSKLKDSFGLIYEIDRSLDIVNSTGFKANYYSINKVAESIGYRAKNTSLEGIFKEISLLK
jgi:nucleoside-diphosphate-sugar epimerase